MPSQKQLDKFFMDTAIQASKMSHCARLKVGCVITRNDRIISTGWNGSIQGFVNCDEVNTNLDLIHTTDEDLEKHHRFSEHFEVHAEMNAIIDLAKRGESPEGCTLYTTIAPCKNCAKMVIAAGIKRVVYKSLYDRDGKYKIDTNGDIINVLSNKENLFKEYNGPEIMMLMGYRDNKEDLIEIEEYKDF